MFVLNIRKEESESANRVKANKMKSVLRSNSSACKRVRKMFLDSLSWVSLVVMSHRRDKSCVYQRRKTFFSLLKRNATVGKNGKHVRIRCLKKSTSSKCNQVWLIFVDAEKKRAQPSRRLSRLRFMIYILDQKYKFIHKSSFPPLFALYVYHFFLFLLLLDAYFYDFPLLVVETKKCYGAKKFVLLKTACSAVWWVLSVCSKLNLFDWFTVESCNREITWDLIAPIGCAFIIKIWDTSRLFSLPIIKCNPKQDWWINWWCLKKKSNGLCWHKCLIKIGLKPFRGTYLS